MALSEDEELELLELEEEEYQHSLRQQEQPKPAVKEPTFSEFAGDAGIALGQGATRGWADEGSAALEKWMGESPLFSTAAEKLGLIDDAQATRELYQQKPQEELLQSYRKRIDLAKERLGEDYGKFKFIGEAPGYFATAKLSPIIGGALEGTVSSLGETDKDKLSSEALLDATKAGVTGAALGYGSNKLIDKAITPAVKYATPIVQKVLEPVKEFAKEKFDDIASTQIARALGGTKKQLINIGEEGINKAGQVMREEGITGLKTSSKLAKLVEERRNQIGQELSKTVDEIARELSDNVPETIIDDSVRQITQNFSKSPIVEKLKSAGATEIDDIAMMEFSRKLKQLDRMVKEPGANFRSLQNFKQVLGDEIDSWRKLMPGDPKKNKNLQQGFKTLYNEVNDQLNQLASFTGMGDKYSKLNKTYSGLSTAHQLGYKQATEAELGSDVGTQIIEAIGEKIPLAGRMLSSPSLRAGGATAALAKLAGLSTPVTGILGAAGAAGAYGTQKFGRQALSSSSDFVVKLLNQNPEALGKFAEPLLRAASRGPSAIQATDYVLQQQFPEYRELINKEKENLPEEE